MQNKTNERMQKNLSNDMRMIHATRKPNEIIKCLQLLRNCTPIQY